MTELHPKAKELLRLAKSEQGPTRAELDAVLSDFERRTATELQEDHGPLWSAHHTAPASESPRESVPIVSRVSPVLLRRASRRGRIRVLRWSLMAAIMTGSLGAFANWASVVQQMRNTFTTLVTEVLDFAGAEREVSKAAPRRLTSHDARSPSSLLSRGPSAPSDTAPDVGSAVVDFQAVVVPSASAAASDAEPVTSSSDSVANLVSQKTAPTSRRSPWVNSVSGEAGGNDSADVLTREVNLIANARAALTSGNYSLTRQLLAEHQSTFPRGTLTEEREALGAIVACRQNGNVSLARRYVARRPQSLFAARLSRECKLMDEGAERPAPAGVGSSP